MYLGIAYYKGKEIERDDREASRLLSLVSPWRKKALFYRLKMMFEGRWCNEVSDMSVVASQDSILAQLEGLAKDKNYPRAQFYLAQILLEDKTVSNNQEKAIMLLRAAAAQGHTKALSKLQSMGEDCTSFSGSKPLKVKKGFLNY
jgi:hypothetical protein